MNDPERDGPLAGLRVLELCAVAAGPFCARLLGDFGAEVVKVEAVDGDGVRSMGSHVGDRSLYGASIMRNKRLVSVDIRDPRGEEIVRRLAAECDFVVESMRPGTLERYGLGYEDLRKRNEGLIMVRISGFGQSGPYSGKPGYGVVCEAIGGLRYISGEPGVPPGRIATPLTDYLTGLYGAFGAVMALEYRRRTGRGQCIDAALYEAAFSFMEPHVPAYAALGEVAERAGSRLPGHTPSNLFLSSDGVYIHIAAGGDAVFRRLCGAMGRQDLAGDARFVTATVRNVHVEEIDALIAEWAGANTADRIEEVLEAAAVPVARLYTIADIFRDPHFRARGMLADVPDEETGGDVTLAAPVPRMSETPGRIRWAGRRIGADTDSVLTELVGLTSAEIEALERDGVIRRDTGRRQAGLAAE